MTKKIFLIAGEASGDVLGSKLIRELKKLEPSAEFIGVGGNLMKAEGLLTIFPMEELSVMGFLEILPHLPKLLSRINQTAQTIIKEQPNFVITIDSPDFSFRVIKKISQEKNIKKIHLIAPSVWAYRAGRAKKIAKIYDLLLAILPFEPPYFERHGLKTICIGHPIMEDAPDFSKKEILRNEFRKKHNILDDEILLCVTPGSRNSEVKKIFGEFILAINLLLDKKIKLKVVIPLALKTRALVEQMAPALKNKYFFIEKEERKAAFFSSDFALAKSGTNTIELSLYKIPMIIAYKVNKLTHILLKMMIKIKFANLVNLISNREIIPEMLQEKCSGEKIAFELEKLILNPALANKQIADSQVALAMMGLGSSTNSSQKAAQIILKL
jgi:lipid-A-disaccharide synthase